MDTGTEIAVYLLLFIAVIASLKAQRGGKK